MNKEDKLKMEKSWVNKMPTIFWILAIPAAIFLVFAGMITAFWALTMVEGVASVGLALAFIGSLRVQGKISEKPNKIVVGIAIAFFALMGMSVDQIGNYVYNQPLGWVFCPAETTFARHTSVSNPLPGSTYVIYDFRCVNKAGDKVKELSMPEMLIGRFVEYVILAYIFIYLNKLFPPTQFKNKALQNKIK